MKIGNLRNNPWLEPRISYFLCTLTVIFTGLGEAQVSDFAGVYDTTYTPPEEALTLQPEGVEKAQALALYFRGLRLEGIGSIDEALEIYHEVLEKDSRNVGLAARGSTLAANFGDVDQGEEILKRSLEMNPDRYEAYLELGRFLLTFYKDDKEKTGEALDYFQEAVTQFPLEPETYQQLIQIHLSDGNRKKAEGVLSQALGQKTVDPIYWLRIASVAKKVWPVNHKEKREENLPKINGLYEKALDSGEGDREIAGMVSAFYIKSKQYEKAATLLEEITSEYPEALDDREQLVRVYRLLKQDDKAMEELQALIRVNPHRVSMQKMLAKMYEDKEDTENAIIHYQKALELQPGAEEDYRTLAFLLLQSEGGRKEECVALLIRATAIFPESVNLHYLLAVTYRMQDENLRAYETFEKISKVVVDDQNISSDFYFEFGATAEQAKKFEQAANLFRKCIEMDPDSGKAYNYLGYMWLELEKNIDEAGELIKRALEYEPESAAFVDSLGWYYFKKKDFPKAVEELTRAMEMMEDLDPVVVFHVGQAYAQNSEMDKAIEMVEKAAELDPEDDKISAYLKALKEGTVPEDGPTLVSEEEE